MNKNQIVNTQGRKASLEFEVFYMRSEVNESIHKF